MSGHRVLVADAAMLVRLIERAELQLCASIPQHRLVLVDQVRHEVEHPSLRAELDRAVMTGLMGIEAITDLADLARYAELARRLGRGEAACLVLAAARGWDVVTTDQRRFRCEIERVLGPHRRVGWVELEALLFVARDRESLRNSNGPRGTIDMTESSILRRCATVVAERVEAQLSWDSDEVP